MSEDFLRVKRLPPYVFSEVNTMKLNARSRGLDIIDFGMGNPDIQPPDHVVEKVIATIQNPKTHRYSVSRGINGLRRANADYYYRRFNVDIDLEKETIVTLGSKEGFANLAMAITSPGDVVLVPNPSYPIHAYGFIIAGGALRHLPVGSAEQMLQELKHAVAHCIPKPLALVLNFPSNPTAQVVTLDFYEEVVEFCRNQGLWILSDLAYAEVYFNQFPPPSILQVKDAREIAVEFTSISKTYSMPGWRIGFATGNAKLIEALARIKSYLDYGAFTPIQVAAAAALNGPQDIVDNMRKIYRRRRDTLIKSFARAGWVIPSPTATMFVWAPIPKPFKEMGSLEFSKLLLECANVAVSPGIGFGEHGEGYVRIALVENEQRIQQAARNIRRIMLSPNKTMEEFERRRMLL